MPHPADHPAAALAITRGLTGQLQKAKANGDHAAQAIEAALARARRIVANGSAPSRQERPRQPLPPPPPPDQGWAEIVMDRHQRRR